MAITMRDRFLVRAPIAEVWDFLVDPHRVVLCMPGAHLEEIESPRAFVGHFKLAIGPFTTSYKGRVVFAELDKSRYWARLTAEGHERGGGPAQGSMVSSLRTVDDATEVAVDISVEGANKFVQMGLALGEDVAHELFGKFVVCVKERLEAPAGATHRDDAWAESTPVQVVPLLAKAFMRRFGAERSQESDT